MKKFYSRKGDEGYTGLLGKERVAKYHPKIEAIGATDEASAALGMARSLTRSPETASVLLSIQQDLNLLMGEVAASQENAEQFKAIGVEKVAWLEAQIDHFAQSIEMPKEFILPGNTQAGAALAMARTIIRRAERRMAMLLHKDEITNPDLYRYLNRASSLCFVLELYEYSISGAIKPDLAK